MRRIELQTSILNAQVAFRHPYWLLDYLKGGRQGLLSSVVRDSIKDLSRVRVPESLQEIATLEPVSALGKMGAAQELLYLIVRWLKPRNCIETGVYRGVSSAFILAALSDNGVGHLSSIDLPSGAYLEPASNRVDSSPLMMGERPGFVVPESHRSRWTLSLGDSRQLLPKLVTECGPVDLFYHDSEHTYDFMMWEFETAATGMKNGGVLVSDDAVWNNAFTDFCAGNRVEWSTMARDRLGIAMIRSE